MSYGQRMQFLLSHLAAVTIQLQLPDIDSFGHFISSLSSNIDSSVLLSVLHFTTRATIIISLVLVWFFVISQFRFFEVMETPETLVF